jgi:hypothetical protein
MLGTATLRDTGDCNEIKPQEIKALLNRTYGEIPIQGTSRGMVLLTLNSGYAKIITINSNKFQVFH